MLDETLLDDPAALRERDHHAALLALAVTGARVRTAVRLAREAGIADLAPEGRPRHILVAGQGTAALAGDTLAALSAHACPITVLRPTGVGDPEPGEATPTPGARWTLPGWVGPMDLLVLLSAAPTEAGLASLVRQGYRRGSSLVVIAAPGSPLAAVATDLHAYVLPYAPPGPTESIALSAGPAADARADQEPDAPPEPDARPEPAPGLRTTAAPETTADPAPAERPGTLWGLLTPLLLLADRLRLLAAPPEELERTADRLDEAAARCGAASPTHDNPAKSLADRLSETLPLVWADGPVAAVAADRFAAALTAHAGVPALVSRLPDAFDRHRGLLDAALAAGKDAEEDFFRDRVEEPERARPHLVLLGLPGGSAEQPAPVPDDGRIPGRLRDDARHLAAEYQLAVTEPEAAPGSSPVAELADLLTTLDFAAAYLHLATPGG